MFSYPSDFFSSQILSALKEYNILIITGETGSGKTTRIPFFIYFSILFKNKTLICSQPRRLATISVAKRIASQAKVTLGMEIGYLIRFENCTTKKTKLKFTTDGFLLKEFLLSPCLDQYEIVIIDEAHERSSDTDLILSLSKSLIEIRSDLKIVITSATLEIEKYSVFFDNCPVFCIPGRTFCVKTFFSKFQQKNFRLGCIDSLIFLIKKYCQGDILVFLPGKDEIDFIGHHLSFWKKKNSPKKKLIVVPVFSELPWTNQMKALRGFKNKRKIILSTNLTETSLTIPNISFVLDSGLMKQQIFNPKKLSGDLFLTHIGKANAIQRKGRAGRIGPGKCFRLFSKWSFNHEMEVSSIPGLQKIDLTNIILFIKILGVDSIFSLDWIDFPEKYSLLFSFQTLYSLKALGNNGRVTDLGRKMVEFPVKPMTAKTIIFSREFNREEEILSIFALLLIPFNSYQSVFEIKKTKNLPILLSDHLFLLKIFKKWEKTGYSLHWCLRQKINFKNMQLSNNIKTQLWNTGRRIGKTNCPRLKKEKLLNIITKGFFFNFAILKKKGFYCPIFSRKNFLVPITTKSLFSFSQKLPFLVCFYEIFFSKNNFLRVVSPIKKKFLKQFL
mmetsp:Transcript_38064/g.76166  ORF Transcript_38064/g.76166 Transcript_38064/m.76166 type:complete len:614 (-) Transcript_38064:1464-3305(-)